MTVGHRWSTYEKVAMNTNECLLEMLGFFYYQFVKLIVAMVVEWLYIAYL